MNKKETNEVRIRNISLKPFIDHLIAIYNMGGEWIDIVGQLSDKQDTLGIVVYGPESKDKKPERKIRENSKLSEDILKQLYNGIN